MSTSVEINAVDTKFEVNSNLKIDRDDFDSGAADKKVAKDSSSENQTDGGKNRVQETVTSNGCENGESVVNSCQPNKESGRELMETNADTCQCEVMAVVNGEGVSEAKAAPDESPSNTDGGESPQNDHDHSKNFSESPISIEHVDGETDSIGSGKSPKKKRGFLSGGLHIHMPKFSSRLSFGSDVSATSTGSEVDGSPDKKKKKKDKKGKKKAKVEGHDTESPDKVAQSECSESLASERIEDVSVSVTDAEGRLDQPENQEEMDKKDEEILEAADEKPIQATVSDAQEENKEDANKAEGVVTGYTVGLEEENVSSAVAVTADVDRSHNNPQAEEGKDASTLEAIQTCPQTSDEQEPPSRVVEESTPEQPATSEAEQSTANPGAVPPVQGDEGTPPVGVDEEKTGATSSGEEGEGEDEGETEDEKQKEKKKRKKGILNVHFPHFGGKKSRPGEKSSDQSSDSDRAMSPKRFGWKKRKDAKSPERREQSKEAGEKEAPGEVKPEEVGTVESTSPKEEEDTKEGEPSPGIAVSLSVDAKGESNDATEGSATAPSTTEADLRPEEKLLAECQELVDGGTGEKDAEEFASTDALLEEIADTITSIEKAQNLRASQAMDVNISADTAPEVEAPMPKAEEGDEPGISLPSAQITLAVPTESTLVEVSEEEKSDNHAVTETDGNKENAGESEPKETQEGEAKEGASPSEKEKSSRFRGKLHLPKFHLPKVHLSGKKDKKKTVHAEEDQADSSPDGDRQGNDSPQEQEDATGSDREISGAVALDLSAEGVNLPEAKIPEGDSGNADVAVNFEDAPASRGVQLDISVPGAPQEQSGDGDDTLKSDIRLAGSPEVAALPDVDGVVADISTNIPANAVSSEGQLGDAEISTKGLEISGPYDNVDVSDALPERQEVIVVMNEGSSEEEEAEDLKKEDSVGEQGSFESKPKKSRFKMPSLNFHLPKFGGAKKSYKVEAEAEGDVSGAVTVPEEDDIAEGGGGENVPAAAEDTCKLDAEVNAGGGDISVEPDSTDGDALATKGEVEVNLQAAISAPDTSSAEQLVHENSFPEISVSDPAKPSIEVQVEDAKTNIENQAVAVHVEIPPVPDANVDISLSPEEVPSIETPGVGEQIQAVSVDAPEVEAQVDVPDVTVAAEEPQLPALDREASLKAKRKGLSLPVMHFHRPKFVGRKWSRHPRFRSKVKGEKSLGASGKVTTSLPDVALATSSEGPLSEEERRARRASDIIDPKVAAAISSEHEISASGDDIAAPNKSWRGKFRFPSVHFSLPRFSSLLSPGKAKHTVEVEPEMTELKAADVEVDITAEADIPKTNLDVVMPEISATVESVPEVHLEGAVGGDANVVAPGESLDKSAPTPVAEIDIPESKVDIKIRNDPPAPEVNAEIELEDAKAQVEVPEFIASPAVKVESGDIETTPGKDADIGVTLPNVQVSDVEAQVDIGADVESTDVKHEEDVNAPATEVTAESPDTATDHTRKKGFFPKMHLPKFNVKLTPMKFKSKGKKGAVEVPDTDREANEEVANSTDLSMVVNTSGDPNVTVDGDTRVPNVEEDAKELEKDVCGIDLPKTDLSTDADVVVKKSETDVKSPSIEADASVSKDPGVDLPDMSTAVQVDVGSLTGNEKGEDEEALPIAGTVVIEYDMAIGASDAAAPKVELGATQEKKDDAEVKLHLEEDVKSPELDVSSGATNEVLDLALGGGADVEFKVDGNVADVNISSEDEDGDAKQKRKKKKKKRKGLHIPSISLPKFNLRSDKKAPSESTKIEASLPDVVVGDVEVESEIKADEKAEMPEVVLPCEDVGEKANVSLELSSGVAEDGGSTEPPSAKEVGEVLAAFAVDVSYPEKEQAELVVVGSASLDSSLTVEAPSVQEDTICPKVEPVVESTIPSLLAAIAETPDVSGEDASTSVPQVEVSSISADADVDSPESSTSKPSKTKRGRMPKINLPKMNFKFSSPKSGHANQVPSGDADVMNEEALTPAEIDKIEESLPAGQTPQLTVPTVEVNGVSPENEAEEITPSKKGKYKKRIGGKLKKIRVKGKGKTSAVEDVKGEGLIAGVSLEAETSIDGIVAMDGGLENGVSSVQDGADITPDITLDSDSPLLVANADLITSTPVKSGQPWKNNSAQAASPPTTPESMNLDHAIAVNSLPSATPEAVSPIGEGRPFWVVVAIDFGTTFSGYAYSLRREPDSVHVMRKWEGGDPGVTNMKTPTTLLLTPEGGFHSFGFTARDFYHDMDHKEAMRWLYFDKFKLTLHGNPDLNLKTEISAANGQKFLAITVFEHSLRFFRDHALEELQDLSMEGEVDPRDIRWVLTVPAIWKQPAKQFMRQAAYQAGLVSPSRPDQLLIALEPEAASIYIRKLRMRELAPEHQSQRQKWLRSSTGKVKKSNSQVSESIRHGTRYMVVDCGGGTVDITVHEVEEGLGTLKELHKAAGGMYGSVSIDQEFEQLLVDIFGQVFIDEFKIKRPAGWVDLMIAFEARKRNASPWKNNPLNVSLPFSFIDYYKKYSGGRHQVEEAVRKFDSKDVRWSAQVPGMLRFTPEGMQQLFASTVETLVRGVEEVLSSPSLTGISYLFVVGGFAQSALLQSAIRKKFSGRLRIVIPRDLGLSILKGAVLFGLDPSAVRVRRSRLTYGVGVLNKFQPGVHPEAKRVSKDNADWCRDIFDTFVQSDESVAVGDKVTRSYTPAKPSQQAIVINIYCSDRESVRFITDDGVRKCGTLHIDVSDAQQCGSSVRGRRELQLTMQYGDTEIKVSALDVPTGKCVKSSIDFLNK